MFGILAFFELSLGFFFDCPGHIIQALPISFA